MEDEKSNLDSLKEEYIILMAKYDLPSFRKLNEEFNIEKIAECETDFLLREIRKCMVEKFFGYLKFIEAILHPVSAQMFIFSVIKAIGKDEKDKLVEIYKAFSKQEIEILELDLEYSEENEANFIKKYYDDWLKVKIDLVGIVEVIKKNWDHKLESNGKSYFG